MSRNASHSEDWDYMSFKEELKEELKELEKAWWIMYDNDVFIHEEIKEMEHAINALGKVISYLGDDDDEVSEDFQ